jgi:hypothetical protein
MRRHHHTVINLSPKFRKMLVKLMPTNDRSLLILA